MSLNEIILARQQLDAAQQTIRASAKTTINDEVVDLLSLPGINSVGWSQKSSEYDDEGMYPGIHGPVLNPNAEQTDESDDEEYTYGGSQQDWVYGYGGNSVDPRAARLSEILKTVGDEILSDIFGDSCAVYARLRGDGNVAYDTEHTGW